MKTFVELEKLKENQLEEFMADVIIWKEKVKFSLTTAVFFAFCSLILFVNPILSVYLAIIPTVGTVVFLISAYHRNGYLKMHKNNVRMIHSIHRQIDEVIEDFDKRFDAGEFDKIDNK